MKQVHFEGQQLAAGKALAGHYQWPIAVRATGARLVGTLPYAERTVLGLELDGILTDTRVIARPIQGAASIQLGFRLATLIPANRVARWRVVEAPAAVELQAQLSITMDVAEDALAASMSPPSRLFLRWVDAGLRCETHVYEGGELVALPDPPASLPEVRTSPTLRVRQGAATWLEIAGGQAAMPAAAETSAPPAQRLEFVWQGKAGQEAVVALVSPSGMSSHRWSETDGELPSDGFVFTESGTAQLAINLEGAHVHALSET